MEPARQPPGIPVGGQFAATVHTEPVGVSLVPEPARTPDAQKELLEALFEKGQELHRLQAEMNLMNVDAAIGSVRRHFPAATRLHVGLRRDRSGQSLDTVEPKSLRDEAGNDITAGEKHWYYRREPGDDNLDPGVSIHIGRLDSSFFGYEHEGIGYDTDTGDFVIDMNHTFSS